MDFTRVSAATRSARGRLGAVLPVTVTTIALFAVSPLIAPGSLGASSMATMLPFASILAIAAIGQTLVVQQGGLDFSIGGTMTLSAVLICRTSNEYSVPVAVVLTCIACLVSGLVSGIAISYLRITPLIATLGINAVLLGVVQQVSGGVLVSPAPTGLTEFALGKTFGVFNLLLVALALLLAFTLLMKKTVSGRRFEAVGAGAAAAAAVGIMVNRHKLAAYVLASVSYAIAGIMLAGFLSTPPLNAGDSYLLASIAAVVVGGTALGGGPGSAIGSAIGALFLTQLSQLLLATGSQTSVIYLLQGLVIGASVALRTLLTGRGSRRRSTVPRTPTAPDPEDQIPSPPQAVEQSRSAASQLPESQVR